MSHDALDKIKFVVKHSKAENPRIHSGEFCQIFKTNTINKTSTQTVPKKREKNISTTIL